MKSMVRRFAVAVSLGVLAISSAARAGDDVILVEPLNSTILANLFQTIYQAPAVLVPETICGNPGGSATNLVKCYEFGMTYFTYDAPDGRQRVHLGKCNAVDPFDANCEDPANNLCAGNLTLDPFQIMAPVCGEIRVDVLPVSSAPLVFGSQPTATWDGVSSTKRFQVYISFIAADGSQRSNTFKGLPLIRIPASLVNGGAATVAAVIGRHTPISGGVFDFGFYNLINRTFTYDRQLGDVTNLIVEPLLMTP